MNRKIAFSYLIGTIFLYIFQRVYHLFGHGVRSAMLQYVWIVPLVTLAFYTLLVAFSQSNKGMFWLHVGVVILINGMILQGILTIAGSDSPLIIWYFVVASLCIIMAVGMQIFSMYHSATKERRHV